MLFIYLDTVSIVSDILIPAFWHPNTMASITDPNMSDGFTNAMEEIYNKQLKSFGEIIDATTELCQSHKQFVKSALGMSEELLFIEVHSIKK